MPQIFRAIILMIIGVLFFTLVDLFIKFLSHALPIGEILIVFGGGTAILFWIMMVRTNEAVLDRKFIHNVIMLRCSGEMIGVAALTTALIHASLSTVTALLQTMPLILTAMAAIFLKEKVGIKRLIAILVGFAGVLLVIRPTIDGFNAYSLFALLGALGLAARDFSARIVPRHISIAGLSFYGSVSVVLTGLIFMLFSGGWVMPEGIMILHCFGLIITGALGLWCVSTAMSLADVSAISPFRYVRIVFGMSAGVIVFGEHLDIPTLLGSAIIVGAGLYSWHHERRLVQES